MWGIVESWFPGLRQRLETEQFGIVETPADMQAESDAADEVPADVPANPPTSRPTQAYVPEVGKAPEIGPRMTPPAPATAELAAQAAEAAAEQFAARVPQDPSLPPLDLLDGLRKANALRRRERDDARAERDRLAGLLAAERRLTAYLRGMPDTHDLDGITDGGGRPKRPTSDAAGAVDGSDGPVRLGAADRAPGSDDGAEGGRVGGGDVRGPGRR